jgi:hypothetical protein
MQCWRRFADPCPRRVPGVRARPVDLTQARSTYDRAPFPAERPPPRTALIQRRCLKGQVCSTGCLGRYRRDMVCGVHFFATREDEGRLLDVLGEPDSVQLFPWIPMSVDNPVLLDRSSIWDLEQFGVVNPALGGIALDQPGGSAFTDGTARARAFNAVNWERAAPCVDQGIVDWNRTAALFWERGARSESVLTPSSLGSQADSMTAISVDYQRWVNRSMSWVRRNGTLVWGLTPDKTRSGWDIRLRTVSSYLALPGAQSFFAAGGCGRDTI